VLLNTDESLGRSGTRAGWMEAGSEETLQEILTAQAVMSRHLTDDC
jgi:hypothetical protein